MNKYWLFNLILLLSISTACAKQRTNPSLWIGEEVFSANWSEWQDIPSSQFTRAQEGQILRVKYKNLGPGAQLKLSTGDWSDMPDTHIEQISGVYTDYTITQPMLSALQQGGVNITGTCFTLTEIQLIRPQDLKPLLLAVPVTNNWVFDSIPSITIHIENLYHKKRNVNVQVLLSTDKMQTLTSIQQRVLIPPHSTQEITLSPSSALPPGFYKATCLVDEELARAFVLAIQPTQLISAPDNQTDFRAFWQNAKEQLYAVDMQPKLTEIPGKSTAKRKIYLVELQSIPDGLSGQTVTIRGYYAEPQDGQPHPVIMHYPGYDSGYRPGNQDVKPYCPSGDAEPDYAEFFLSPRGQSINNRAANERDNDGGEDYINTYGDWFAFHFGDKDSYYYRGAFMDCVQAIRFMATRPTSDMNNLFAEGQSQGGAFTYAAAALSDYPFRAIAPAIAFLGDYPDYFQLVNWPAYVARNNQGTMTDEQMYAFLSYFDTKNLATRIACPTIACIGLQDDVCPPHTNIAPYNNLLSTDKKVLFNPQLAHRAANDWYATFMSFFKQHIIHTPNEK